LHRRGQKSDFLLLYFSDQFADRCCHASTVLKYLNTRAKSQFFGRHGGVPFLDGDIESLTPIPDSASPTRQVERGFSRLFLRSQQKP
jgi:hypothetical protein